MYFQAQKPLKCHCHLGTQRSKNLMNGKVKTVFYACSGLFSLTETQTIFKNELKSAASLILTFSLQFLQRYQNHQNAPKRQRRLGLEWGDSNVRWMKISAIISSCKKCCKWMRSLLDCATTTGTTLMH